MRGLINLFSKDVFGADHGGDDLIGRVYEYFIGEFASSEGKRGGEYFTPVSSVKTLVAMLEPEKGIVFDPCCGSGGMFVQSDLFTKHSHQLSSVGQPLGHLSASRTSAGFTRARNRADGTSDNCSTADARPAQRPGPSLARTSSPPLHTNSRIAHRGRPHGKESTAECLTFPDAGADELG
ncbi:MAG TPA: N-6 DNA methylase [Vicinamibacterales bacterium]